MSWEPELEELKRREAFAEELGGAERVKRQKDGGRLTIRERVEQMAEIERGTSPQDQASSSA